MTQIETIILHSIARHEDEAARRQQDDCYAPTFEVWVDIKGSLMPLFNTLSSKAISKNCIYGATSTASA